jgi:hypothetical protein
VSCHFKTLLGTKGVIEQSPLGQRVVLNSHISDKGLHCTFTFGTKGCIEQSPLGQRVALNSHLWDSVIEQSPLGQRVVLKSLTTYLLKISQS